MIVVLVLLFLFFIFLPIFKTTCFFFNCNQYAVHFESNSQNDYLNYLIQTHVFGFWYIGFIISTHSLQSRDDFWFIQHICKPFTIMIVNVSYNILRCLFNTFKSNFLRKLIFYQRVCFIVFSMQITLYLKYFIIVTP